MVAWGVHPKVCFFPVETLESAVILGRGLHALARREVMQKRIRKLEYHCLIKHILALSTARKATQNSARIPPSSSYDVTFPHPSFPQNPNPCISSSVS
jgi:hypothetical protein